MYFLKAFMNKLLFVFMFATFLQPHAAQSMEIVVQKSTMPRRFLHAKVNQLEALFTQNPEADWGDAHGYPYDKTTMYVLWFNHALANMRNTKFIQAFITRGVDVNKPLRFEGQRPYPVSSLAVAVMARTDQHHLYEENYLTNIELLLAKGATFCGEPEQANLAYCLSRLSYQCIGNNAVERTLHEARFVPTLCRLIVLGCSVRGRDGNTPPLISSGGFPLITENLLRSGANPLQEYNGQTILKKAQEDLKIDERAISSGVKYNMAIHDTARQTLGLLEANAAQRKATQEYLPELGKDATSHFAKLPAEIRALVGNYFAW